jgi:hypothetical protein
MTLNRSAAFVGVSFALSRFRGGVITCSVSGIALLGVSGATPDATANTVPGGPHDITGIVALSVMTVGISRAQSAATGHQRSSRAMFDSDSFDILVDDGSATSCISNSMSDLVTPLKASFVCVKGFNGTTSSTKVGTIIWKVLNYSGHPRTLRIHNMHCVPVCPQQILSPQHCSQQTKDLCGTCSTNFGDQVLFVWNHDKHRVTMPLSTATNVGILQSVPGHKVFSAFVCTKEATSLLHFCCPLITDDKADAYKSDSND